MGGTRAGSRFKEALQNPKCLLLLFDSSIFDDAMEFLDQDTWVGFLSFEFEEYPEARHLKPWRWHI